MCFWCRLLRYSRKFITSFVSQVVSRIQFYNFVNLLHPKEMDVMTLVADALEVGMIKACSHSNEIQVSEKSIEPMVQTIDRGKPNIADMALAKMGGSKYHIIIWVFPLGWSFLGRCKLILFQGMQVVPIDYHDKRSPTSEVTLKRRFPDWEAAQKTDHCRCTLRVPFLLSHNSSRTMRVITFDFCWSTLAILKAVNYHVLDDYFLKRK